MPTGVDSVTINRDIVPIFEAKTQAQATYTDNFLTPAFLTTIRAPVHAGSASEDGTKVCAVSLPTVPDTWKGYLGCTQGTALDATDAEITFDVPPGAESITIYRDSVRIAAVAPTDPTTGTYEDTNLTAGSTYKYTCEAAIKGNSLLARRPSPSPCPQPQGNFRPTKGV